MVSLSSWVICFLIEDNGWEESEFKYFIMAVASENLRYIWIYDDLQIPELLPTDAEFVEGGTAPVIPWNNSSTVDHPSYIRCLREWMRTKQSNRPIWRKDCIISHRFDDSSSIRRNCRYQFPWKCFQFFSNEPVSNFPKIEEYLAVDEKPRITRSKMVKTWSRCWGNSAQCEKSGCITAEHRLAASDTSIYE